MKIVTMNRETLTDEIKKQSYRYDAAAVEAEAEKVEKYRHAVVALIHETVTHDMSDYCLYSEHLRVHAWDEEKCALVVFDAVVSEQREASRYSSHVTGLGTMWQVDATPEVLDKVKDWCFTVAAPNAAKMMAERAYNSVIASHDKKVAELRNPKVAKGRLVEIVAGRKYPRGTKGKVFWMGENRWGTSVGIATTERKDETGRYADVIFTSPSNLMAFAATEEIAKADAIDAEKTADAKGCANKVYADTLAKETESWIRFLQRIEKNG
jgi:hypothetical protein